MAKEPTKQKGRPSKFNSIDSKQVEALASRGWTDAEMSSFFGVSEVTWNAWKKKHPEFLKSLKDWKLEADDRVERSLFERACGYSHKEDKIFKPAGEKPTIVPTIKHYAPDSTACIFWLKNRKRDQWRDKPDDVQEDEHGQAPVAVNIEVVDGRKPSS
jgi:hypothetical protein